MKVIIIVLLFAYISGLNVPYIGNPIVERCVACKFIWENVEEALESGFMSERNPILAAQSFQYFCRIAPDIFFEPCNIMFERLFLMTQDYCAKKSVIQICKDNELCPK
jgi:hypothetical protein